MLSSQSADSPQLKDEQYHLDADIAKAQKNFESVAHDRLEVQEYLRFKQKWSDYRAQFEQAFALLDSGDRAGAGEIYFSSWRKAFAAASEHLEQLSARNNMRAQQAGDRAAAAIHEAWNSFAAQSPSVV